MLSRVRSRILLVSPAGGLSSTLAAPLSAAGYETVLAADFRSARIALNQRPDLVIADVKLGAYNGLHLAIRAAATLTPAMVIGDSDPVLEADAARQQAVYVTTPLDAEHILTVVARLVDISWQTRRAARKQVRGLNAFADDLEARLLDVSYHGMRLEAADSRQADLPMCFVVRLPQFSFTCHVQRVWTAPAANDRDGRVTWYGATVSAADSEGVLAWRDLVDALPGLAATL